LVRGRPTRPRSITGRGCRHDPTARRPAGGVRDRHACACLFGDPGARAGTGSFLQIHLGWRETV